MKQFVKTLHFTDKYYIESINVKEESDSEDEDDVLEGPVTIRNEDDSLFEGNYSQGRPHGYFRQINSYGDLDFFGCFYRGTMLGKK